MKSLLFFVLCLISLSVRAVTINVSCDYSAITNGIAQMQEGYTLKIASGSCKMTNQIDIGGTISFTISGSGTNSTILTQPNVGAIFNVKRDSANVFTMNDFQAVGVNNSTCLIVGNTGFDSPGPYHIYNIKMPNIVGRGIHFGDGVSHNSYGLIDHVYGVAGSGYAQMIDAGGARYGAWTNSIPFGTTNAFYIEDCYFQTQSGRAGNGYIDSYYGCQWALRHNFFDGYSPPGDHGYDSSDIGGRSWELYNNIFTNWTTSTAFFVCRSGAGLMYSNTVYGVTIDTFGGLGYYRACPYDHQYTGANSTYTTYALTGQAGQLYTLNMSGASTNDFPLGCSYIIPGNPTNGQQIKLGFTAYTFVSALANHTFAMYSAGANGVYGGGGVLIGASAAETITNLFNAVNSGPGYGTTRTNWNGLPFRIGHEYCAVSMNTTNLVLQNRLDGNTDSYGYPANQQEGVITSFPLTTTNFVNNQTVWGCYSWSNLNNGVLRNFDLGTTHLQCGYDLTNLVQEGRDFFNNTIPSAGKYTALVYPHPMQSLEVNPFPTITTMTNVSINQDTSTAALPFTLGNGLTNVASYTMSGTSTNTILLPNANIVFGGSGANRTATLTPAAGQFGTTLITITVSDEVPRSANTTFLLTVAQTAAQPPTITSIANQNTTVLHSAGDISFTIADPVYDPTNLVVTATSSDQTFVQDFQIMLGGTAAVRTINITPLRDGSGTFTVQAINPVGASTNTTFSVTATGNASSPGGRMSRIRYLRAKR